MTLYQFNSLDEAEQIEVVWNSVLIATREDEDFEYELFQIDSFYAELRYKKGEKALSQLKTFSNTDLLEPYLKTIWIQI